jgi:cell wall-associated NlpC family hydrolase
VRNVARRLLAMSGAGLALPVLATVLTQAPAQAALPPASGSAPGQSTDYVHPGQPSGPFRPPSQASLAAAAQVVTSRHGAPAALPKLGKRLQADLLVVAPSTLPAKRLAHLQQLPGVTAVQPVDAAQINVDGKLIAMLGVNPASFRAFAAKPTAESATLWDNVSAGQVAVSYTMGRLDKVALNQPLTVSGRTVRKLNVAGFGTVGIAGIDAVVSDQVARSLGLPAGNAAVISAPHTSLAKLTRKITKLLPHGVSVAPLVAQAPVSGTVVSSGGAGTPVPAGSGPGMSSAQLTAFLKAAESRLGLPYVWGAAGPNSFDCSGLVQWSLARAGVTMPRVAADQARTGPRVPVSQVAAGDLLFYHTDPTAPDYISHVAIYLGHGLMLQAPEPGMNVQVVPADFGSGFAGAVRVYPAVAAAAAGNPAG